MRVGYDGMNDSHRTLVLTIHTLHFQIDFIPVTSLPVHVRTFGRCPSMPYSILIFLFGELRKLLLPNVDLPQLFVCFVKYFVCWFCVGFDRLERRWCPHTD